MNELERLIAAVSRPEPSIKLDERVNALLAQEPPCLPRRRWRNVLVLCGTSACIGLLGFWWGRQSVVSTPESPAITSTASVPAPPPETLPASANVTNIPLREDQLSGLFLRPSVREGMLGNGPVKIVISNSP